MLKELKFVMGAVAKKDLVPAMTHFRIQNGTVRAYNGALALSSPISVDLDCTPKAAELVRAISKCEETIVLSLTPAGKLRIVSGQIRGFVDCIDGETPHVEPSGEDFELNGEDLLKAIKTLMPFVGNDASRPWTNGILLKGSSAFATNNVCVVEYWLGTPVPFIVNVPGEALREMVRVNEAPIRAQLEPSSVTFHYADQRWIRTQLLVTTWPEVTQILDKPSAAVPIHPDLFAGLDALTGFVDNIGRVFIRNDMLSTTYHNKDEGMSFSIPGLGWEGCYQIEKLRLLEGIATHADFSLYPAPSLFFGERLRGAIVGMRM